VSIAVGMGLVMFNMQSQWICSSPFCSGATVCRLHDFCDFFLDLRMHERPPLVPGSWTTIDGKERLQREGIQKRVVSRQIHEMLTSMSSRLSC